MQNLTKSKDLIVEQDIWREYDSCYKTPDPNLLIFTEDNRVKAKVKFSHRHSSIDSVPNSSARNNHRNPRARNDNSVNQSLNAKIYSAYSDNEDSITLSFCENHKKENKDIKKFDIGKSLVIEVKKIGNYFDSSFSIRVLKVFRSAFTEDLQSLIMYNRHKMSTQAKFSQTHHSKISLLRKQLTNSMDSKEDGDIFQIPTEHLPENHVERFFIYNLCRYSSRRNINTK